MVILDSSAVIPLIRIGRLDLLQQAFSRIIVPLGVWNEVVVEGQKLGKPVSIFMEGRNQWFSVEESRNEAESATLAAREGIEPTDAEVLLLTKKQNDILLTNDAALHACCRAHSVKVWWLTTLLLVLVKQRKIPKSGGETILLELVHTGKMRLSGEILSELLSILRNL